MITIDARMRRINAVDFLIISHSPPYICLFNWNVVFCGFPDHGQVVRNGKSSPETGPTGIAYITSC